METKHQYRALDVSRNEIRVVRLAPSRYHKANASCSIIHTSLDDNIFFEALSYTWGDPVQSCRIDLDGRKFFVTRNLEIALRYLRYAEDERYLWIDALCINQDDISEKNQQVPKMGQIYQTAAKVVVWLGLRSKNSDIAIDFSLEACTRRFELQAWMFEVMKNPGRVEHWRAAVNLFERDYWRRVWIFQEIFYAKSLIVRCGFRCIRWSDFILLYRTLGNAHQFFASGQDLTPVMGKGVSVTLANLQNRVVLPVYIEQCRKNAENSKVKHCQPLIQLLMFTRNSLCSNPLDNVYGVAGMAIQYDDHRALKIDYELSVREAYIETARVLIERNKDCRPGPIGIICASKPHLSDGSLPSWVPDWSTSPSQNSYAGIGSESTLFHANGTSPPEPVFRIASDVLTARGIRIANIHHIGEMPLHLLQIGLMNPLQLARYASGPNSPDSVFFTARKLAMSTSRGMPHSMKPLETRRKEFTRTILLNHGMPSYISGYELVPENVFTESLSEDVVQKFCREVISRVDPGDTLLQYMVEVKHATHRKLLSMAINNLRKYRFCVSSDGSYVMGPPSVLEGDLVCILFGCDMPVILRENGKSGYVYVGECYMHGIMGGEAIEGLRAGKYEVKDFQIH